MNLLRKPFEASPVLVRAAPFAVFVGLTLCQGRWGEASAYWFYLVKTVVGVWLIWEMRPFVTELRWAFSGEAIVVGIGVCALWIGLDGYYPKVSELAVKLGWAGSTLSPAALPWNPHRQFGDAPALAWFFVGTRFLGSALVVPVIEEVFFRSLLYRSIVRADFQSVPFDHVAPMALLLTSVLFAFEHQEWLPGLLCGFAYQGLVLRKNRLGDAITAHAITNFLLGVWVVAKGAWYFW